MLKIFSCTGCSPPPSTCPNQRWDFYHRKVFPAEKITPTMAFPSFLFWENVFQFEMMSRNITKRWSYWRKLRVWNNFTILCLTLSGDLLYSSTTRLFNGFLQDNIKDKGRLDARADKDFLWENLARLGEARPAGPALSQSWSWWRWNYVDKYKCFISWI